MRIIERWSAPVLFILLAVCALSLSIFKPFLNWDMIGYIAAAKSFEERNLEALHFFTYDQLRRSIPPETYEKLAQGSYGQAILTDPSAFKEQLPFYQTRLFYAGLIYLFYKSGVQIGFATYLISGVAVTIAIAILYLISVSFLAKPLIYAVPPMAVIFGVLDLARYSTPDGLAFLAVIFSAYLYLRGRITLLLILLPLMLCVRTDLILYTMPLLIYILMSEHQHRWKAVVSMLVSAVIYIGIGAYWRYPGWSTIIYFTLVERLAHPISVPPRLSANQYLAALFKGTLSIINSQAFILYVLLTGYWLYTIKIAARTIPVASILRSPVSVIASVSLVFVILHFLAFPVIWDRFFSAQYLLGAFGLLIVLTGYIKRTGLSQ